MTTYIDKRRQAEDPVDLTLDRLVGEIALDEKNRFQLATKES